MYPGLLSALVEHCAILPRIGYISPPLEVTHFPQNIFRATGLRKNSQLFHRETRTLGGLPIAIRRHAVPCRRSAFARRMKHKSRNHMAALDFDRLELRVRLPWPEPFQKQRTSHGGPCSFTVKLNWRISYPKN
jgi:hypothetical protein